MHKTTEDGSHRRAHAKVSYVYACVLSATAATQGNKATREGEWSCLETKGKFRALLVGLGLGLGLLGPALLSGWALAGWQVDVVRAFRRRRHFDGSSHVALRRGQHLGAQADAPQLVV